MDRPSPLMLDPTHSGCSPQCRMLSGAAGVVAVMALISTLLSAAHAAPGIPELRIAGVLPDSGDTIERWCWSGAWVYPVGNPRVLGQPERKGDAGFRVLRSVQKDRRGHVTHQGADLSNRRGGATVRAASSGLVVRAARDRTSGYGEHVVLAHRLGNGGLVYSVYAHLAPGSTTVRAGHIVPAGKTLGRVGRTGRASADHLHFEIRRPQDSERRWEQAGVEDPLAFIEERLASDPDSGSWAGPYLEWAEASALIDRRAATEAPLERTTWWSMLARAARHSLHDLPSDVALAKRLLSELGVLNERTDRDDGRTVEWSELRRDLERLATVGIRLPVCLATVITSSGISPVRVAAMARERGETPTLADACFELAELASPQRAPEPLPSR